MTKTRILTIFGTRPEATKMAPVIKELAKWPDFLETRLCVTAQHREMLDQVLATFQLRPEYDLNLMKPKQTLSSLSRLILVHLEPVIQDFKPDMVLVHGDTLTTFMGALLSFYSQIKVGHVEAGLRTYDKMAPYPEEMNRQLTARIADLHFSPTHANKQNLLAERIPSEHIFLTGNTAIDAIQTTVQPDFIFQTEILNQVVADGRRIITIEAHRRENLGQPMQEIVDAIRELALTRPDMLFVWPLHLNPAVRDVAKMRLSGLDNVFLLEPLEMLEMHNLMSRSYLVLTDSGGLQEEAPALGKPVLLLRDVTERQEAVNAGTVLLIGPHKQAIIDQTNRLLGDHRLYKRMADAPNPFGDGRAAERIVQALLYYFGHRKEYPEEFLP